MVTLRFYSSLHVRLDHHDISMQRLVHLLIYDLFLIDLVSLSHRPSSPVLNTFTQAPTPHDLDPDHHLIWYYHLSRHQLLQVLLIINAFLRLIMTVLLLLLTPTHGPPTRTSHHHHHLLSHHHFIESHIIESRIINIIASSSPRVRFSVHLVAIT